MSGVDAMSEFRTRQAVSWARENLVYCDDDPCDNCVAWIDYINREGEYLEKTVFAIDNNIVTHTLAKFLRHVDTQRAMGNLKGSIVHCIGSWVDDDGYTHLEPSYMVDSVDYYAVVADSGYVDKQICVLKVPGDTRQPCSLEFRKGYSQGLGHG